MTSRFRPGIICVGAQTQRSHLNFPIGVERFRWGRPVIRALGILKKCAALANGELGQLPEEKVHLIVRAAQEVIDGRWDDEFPLVVFQTGSGTQTNMNANEVIANRAIQLAGGVVGSKKPIHPNDHVNHSQSSNDTFPTAMHITTVEAIENVLFPAVRELRDVLDAKSRNYRGRCHGGPDAHLSRRDTADTGPVDLRLGCARSSTRRHSPIAFRGVRPGNWRARRSARGSTLIHVLGRSPHGEIAEETGKPFVSAPNKFAALSAHDGMVTVSGMLRTLAGALLKNRQRCSLVCLWSARGSRRSQDSGKRTRLFDHAREN